MAVVPHHLSNNKQFQFHHQLLRQYDTRLLHTRTFTLRLAFALKHPRPLFRHNYTSNQILAQAPPHYNILHLTTQLCPRHPQGQDQNDLPKPHHPPPYFLGRASNTPILRILLQQNPSVHPPPRPTRPTKCPPRRHGESVADDEPTGAGYEGFGWICWGIVCGGGKGVGRGECQGKGHGDGDRSRRRGRSWERDRNLREAENEEWKVKLNITVKKNAAGLGMAHTTQHNKLY